MEDMARLALVEQNVRDTEKFNKILFELLRYINHILEYPYDSELRTIKSDVLEKFLEYEAVVDYLKSIGFQSIDNKLTYPKEQPLSNLRMAQAAIERKIYFCCGSQSQVRAKTKSSHSLPHLKSPKLMPAKILKTNNNLLLEIQRIFNHMITYEDEELQALAREYIPLVTLQLMAVDRMREHQRQLKTGEIKGRDLPFDIALLMELLGWFKYKFFSWVDKPECEQCGEATVLERNSTVMTETEKCNVEVYRCTVCMEGKAEFVRYNDLRTLLRTRRGRCGEWANCFTLLCCALGYDTRYVYDTTDHVWCEVFDYDTNTWLHADPCEAQLNAPLVYSHGWGKRISYVIAVSRDDLQDVTWRYTTDHKEVLKRRTLCSESELIQTILVLREHRQRQVSEARRRYLAKRCLQELAQLMVERKPSDYECHGRISGSKEWRSERGEMGALDGHVFRFEHAGRFSVTYCTATDRYCVTGSGGRKEELSGWPAGVFAVTHVFRKIENDWKMVYLARQENDTSGTVSWKLSTNTDHHFSSLAVKVTTMLYENGNIEWTVKFDDGEPEAFKLGDTPTQFSQKCKHIVLCAVLSGGRGECAWQHAQLFRQPLDADAPALELHVNVVQGL